MKFVMIVNKVMYYQVIKKIVFQKKIIIVYLNQMQFVKNVKKEKFIILKYH